MKKRNRVLALTMAAAMSASLLAGCGSSTQQGGAAASSEASASTTAAADGEEDNIIRVGAVCSMTGGSAIYGEGAQNAIDMAQFVKEPHHQAAQQPSAASKIQKYFPKACKQRRFHAQFASFFRFMAANLSLTHCVTRARPLMWV